MGVERKRQAMQVDEMVQCLIGIGASIGADCKPCLEACIAMARMCGADEQDIEAARAVGEKVRRCAGKATRTTDGQNEESWAEEKGSTACCGSTSANS